MIRFRYRALVIAALSLGLSNARAASLSELYARVPAPPGDVGSALGWMQDGKLVAPDYLSFKQAIDTERASIATLAGSYPELVAAPAPDPGEPAEVQGAVLAYNRYLADNADKNAPVAKLGKRTRWLQAAMGGRLVGLLEKMQPCATPCMDTVANAQNQPLIAQRDRLAQQDLEQWNALFADWRGGRVRVVEEAQRQIAATGEGARAQGGAARLAVARYRAAMLTEIEVLLSVTELAVKRAHAIETGQPDAVSSSTRSYKPAAAK